MARSRRWATLWGGPALISPENQVHTQVGVFLRMPWSGFATGIRSEFPLGRSDSGGLRRFFCSRTWSNLQNSGSGQSCAFSILTAHEELLGSFKKNAWRHPRAGAGTHHLHVQMQGEGPQALPPPPSLCFLLYKTSSLENVLSQADPGLHSCLDQALSVVIIFPIGFPGEVDLRKGLHSCHEICRPLAWALPSGCRGQVGPESAGVQASWGCQQAP